MGEALPDTGAMPGTFVVLSVEMEDASASEALANSMGKMLQHLTTTVGGKGFNDYGVTPDTQFEAASRTQLKIGMSEKKFDIMYESFGAMEKEYCTMFRASVVGVLSFCLGLTQEW